LAYWHNVSQLQSCLVADSYSQASVKVHTSCAHSLAVVVDTVCVVGVYVFIRKLQTVKDIGSNAFGHGSVLNWSLEFNIYRVDQNRMWDICIPYIYTLLDRIYTFKQYINRIL
jgi:hypothetical protein